MKIIVLCEAELVLLFWLDFIFYLFTLTSMIKLINCSETSQDEIISNGGQLEPPGMHMIYLPYSDDIRNVEEARYISKLLWLNFSYNVFTEEIGRICSFILVQMLYLELPMIKLKRPLHWWNALTWKTFQYANSQILVICSVICANLVA